MGERGRALYRERASKREGKREAKLTATERKRKERRARKKKYGNIDRERMGDRRGAIEEKNRSARREEREREREREARATEGERKRERGKEGGNCRYDFTFCPPFSLARIRQNYHVVQT